MDYVPVVGALHRLELLRRIRGRGLIGEAGLHMGQPPLLQFIYSHPGCTQREAAQELDVTPASSAASLKRLEKAGLVERRPDYADARRNRLYVTALGKEKLRECQRRFQALDERMFAGMSENEIAAFRSACEKMFENLADESCRHLTICKLALRAREEEKEEDKA